MTDDERPTVLVVDDDRDIASLYSTWLADEYTVTTAYSGPEGLEAMNEEIDVMLLDRRMPELRGEAVLDRIRERGLDCRVALVTAVEPDFDILELGFDEYLCKPVSEADLHDVVETLLDRQRYDATVQQYYQLVSKRAILMTQKGDAVTDHPRFQELEAEIESLTRQLEAFRTELSSADYEAELRRL